MERSEQDSQNGENGPETTLQEIPELQESDDLQQMENTVNCHGQIIIFIAWIDDSQEDSLDVGMRPYFTDLSFVSQ